MFGIKIALNSRKIFIKMAFLLFLFSYSNNMFIYDSFKMMVKHFGTMFSDVNI